MSAPTAGPALLGQTLLGEGLLRPEQLHIALEEQRRSGERLGRVLVRLGLVAEARVREALGAALGHPTVELDLVTPEPEALALLPEPLARRLRVLPLALEAGGARLSLAMADPQDLAALDQLQALLGPATALLPRLAGEADLDRAHDRAYGVASALDAVLASLANPAAGRVAEGRLEDQPAVRLVDALLEDAVRRGASDVHIGPEPGFVRLRLRIDGVLQPLASLARAHFAPLAVRLKVMAGMDIAESRAPQDGRFSRRLGGRAVDFRVSTLPTVQGENLVLRILDRERALVPLAALGLAPAVLGTLQGLLARPEGLTLVCGPTGSGKTTTLYALLGHLSSEAVNVLTLEDPVEYPLPLLRQCSLTEAVKLDFAGGVRAMLRQDPDVLLIGEIRDAETAAMALRAAMTGHRVFATLHSHSALGALPRLRDLGVAPELLAGHLAGVIAQRLVRALCPRCRRPRTPGAPERALLGEAGPVYGPGGCPACDGLGYRGRLALMEVLRVEEALDGCLASGAAPAEFARLARVQGFRPLAEAGLERVREGRTSIEELARVVDLGGVGWR